MAADYSVYLRLERLLALQSGLGDDERGLAPSELLFIVVHQVDELWFKLVLHELGRVRDVLAQDHVDEPAIAPAAAGLRRAVKALELAAAHFALIETMSPRDFLEFRGKLAPGSGFQSPQFRELEMLLGLDAAARPRYGGRDPMEVFAAPKAGVAGWAARKVAARANDLPTLKQALERWLARTPIDGSTPGAPDDEARVAAFLAAYLECHHREVDAGLAQARAGGIADAEVVALHEAEKAAAERFLVSGDDVRADPRRRRVRAAALFIESYRELPLLSWPREVLDLAVQLEQAFLIFRQRHARMVERMIGSRVGTGGSDGVQYLDATALRGRIFEDLWKVRRLLVQRSAAPPLRHAAFYGFRAT